MSVDVQERHMLDQLAARANGKHRAAYQAAMTMLYAGMDAGDALLEAKAQIPRGEWLDWCQRHLEFNTTTACSYMSVARYRDELLDAPGIDTMQKALRYLRQHKLTTQSRIDAERIAEIRAAADEHGINGAAKLLGESYGTVQRYANGAEKQKRGKPPGSGTQQRIAIDDEMIERLAAWMCRRFGKGQTVNDKVRQVALEALQAALGVGIGA